MQHYFCIVMLNRLMNHLQYLACALANLSNQQQVQPYGFILSIQLVNELHIGYVLKRD